MAPPRASVVGIPTACRGGTATGPWRTRAPVAVLIRLPAMGRHKLLWEPSAERIERATITRFARTVGHEGGYDDLWRWSVEDLEGLWAAVWDFFDVRASAPYQRVLGRREMPGAQWFPGARLSYAEHFFRDRDDDAVAIRHASELRELSAWTWGELREQTARIAAGLRRLGVRRGDRVAQIEPKVLLAIDGYRYGGRDFDRREVVAGIAAEIGTRVVPFGHLDGGGWPDDFVAELEPLRFEHVAFDDPLWVLYSSGTTGLPKPIVHGHGGMLMEQLKHHHLHLDAQAGDRFFWFTTTGWMMWNILVSGLTVGSTIVLYDGNPMYPGPDAL